MLADGDPGQAVPFPSTEESRGDRSSLGNPTVGWWEAASSLCPILLGAGGEGVLCPQAPAGCGAGIRGSGRVQPPHRAELGVGVGPGDARNKQTSSAGLPAPPWQDVCVFSSDSI